MTFIIYFLIGIITGVLSGLLGLGGGVIMVPALVFMFSIQDFPKEHMMHLATGTSLGAMIITTIVTTWSYHRRKAVQWHILRSFLPGMTLGALGGVFLAQYISTKQLKLIFAVFITILGIRFMRHAHKIDKTSKRMPASGYLFFIAVLIGVLAGMLGLGGGILLIPLLLWLGLSMVQASATSAACAFPTALMGALMAMMVGWHHVGLPPGSWGFVYWPGALSLGLASILSAPFGVSLAHYLPVSIVKRFFGLLLVCIALRMLWLAL